MMDKDIYYVCAHCSTKFQSRNCIIRHLKKCEGKNGNQTHGPASKIHTCDHCQKEFLSFSGLCRHRKKTHAIGSGERSNKEKTLKCSYCSAMFASRLGRILHAKKKHPEYVMKMNELNTRKLYECVFCHKSFTRKTYRNQHEDVCMNKVRDVTQTQNNSNMLLDDDQCEDTGININTAPSVNSVSPLLASFENPTSSTPNEASISSHPTSSTPNEASISNVSGNIDVTPRLQRYVRDRKSFLLLRSPDVDSPRRARLNLKYGQEVVKECHKEINALKQRVRRLEDDVKTFKDLILHLEEQNKISESAAQTFLVGVHEVICV